MTVIQSIHHEEQMEAARADFRKQWNEIRLELSEFSDLELNQLKVALWRLFLAVKGLRK